MQFDSHLVVVHVDGGEIGLCGEKTRSVERRKVRLAWFVDVFFGSVPGLLAQFTRLEVPLGKLN